LNVTVSVERARLKNRRRSAENESAENGSAATWRPRHDNHRCYREHFREGSDAIRSNIEHAELDEVFSLGVGD
jgi:hypothetical protein